MNNCIRALWFAVFCAFMVSYSVSYAADERLNARLLRAASEGDAYSISDSLSKGAFVDARDKLGNTPLILAADAGYQDAVRVLLNGNAAVNAVNLYGYGALLSAVANSHRYIASMLLKAGADPFLPNKFGTSAADYAKALGYADLGDYLRADGVTAEKGKRGAVGVLHASAWKDRFTTLVSEGKTAEAVSYMVDAAHAGDPEAQFLLGRLLIEKNKTEEGLGWLKKAERRAGPDLLYEIGRAVTDGNPPLDMATGKRAFEKSLKSGNLLSATEYAKILLNEGDYGKAYGYFKAAAMGGVPEAEFYEGYMMYAGKGSTGNEEEGLKYIGKAASAGVAEARDFLSGRELERLIVKLKSALQSERAVLKTELLSMNAVPEKSDDRCDRYSVGHLFGRSCGIVGVRLCYDGTETVKTSYEVSAGADETFISYLKNLSGGADFALSNK